MKKIICSAFLLAYCTTAFGQEQMPPMPEPTKQHKELAKDVGEWEGEMKMWMGPETEPMSMPVSETNRLTAGGLWLISEFHCGPYTGTGMFGYDTRKQEHLGTWVENGSTHMSVMRGKLNDDGELVMHMIGFDPQTQQEREMKSVTSRVGEEEKKMVMYQKNGDEWVKSFEIHYHKKS